MTTCIASTTFACDPRLAGVLDYFGQLKQLTVSFCGNGLLFMSEEAAFFIERESALDFFTEVPTSVSLTAVSSQSPHFPVSPHARAITISLNHRAGKLTLCVMTPGEVGRTIAAESLVSVTPNNASPTVPDALVRVITHLGEADASHAKRYEGLLYADLPPVLGDLRESHPLSIALRATHGTMVLSISGEPINGEVSSPCATRQTDATITGVISTRTLSLALILGGIPIIGVTPGCGDHPQAWYARSSLPGGRLTVLL